MYDPHGDTSVATRTAEFANLFFAEGEPEHSVTFGAASHIGRVRTQNEDHYAVVRLRRRLELLKSSLPKDAADAPDALAHALVVADGMGGMKSGELASRLALQTMLELVSQATSWNMTLTNPEFQQIEKRIKAYVRKIHEALCERSRQDPAATDMGTTWTSAHLLRNQAVLAHMGDSRAYLFRDGALRQITRDETMAQALIDGGLPPETVTKFRHIVLNSFGGGNEQVEAKIHYVELEPGDRLLLCTDGLVDMVPDAQIAAELGKNPEPQAACDALVARALANGGKDNVTVVLAAIGGE
ncbi:MAG: protein phosphatase 2C domain-containing protein [Planctomycetaceae bacterium]